MGRQLPVAALGLAVSGLLVVGLAAIGWLDHQTRLERERRVEREIHQLVTSQIESVPDVLAQLDQWPAEVQPRLRTQYETLPAGSADRLRIALGRLPAEPSLQPELLAAALAPETLPEPLTVIVRRLARLRESHPVDWAAIYRDPDQDLRTRFRAFVAEVSLAAEASPEWAGHAPLMATAFAAEPSPTWRAWLERLQPAREALLPAFQDWFARDYPNPEPMALGVLACQPNSTKAMEQWVQELPTWKTAQFQAALNAVVLRDLKNQFVMAARQRWTGESDPWAQASLGVALARCGEIGPLVELYSQDTESSSAILAVHASVPDRLPPLSLRQIYQQFPLSQMEQTSLRRSMLLALALQAPAMVDTGLRDWLAEVAFHHVVHDPDACCFSAAELILRRLGHDPVQRGRPERRARSNPDGVWGQVLVDQTGLAFSLLPAPGTNDGARQIAVCTTELTLPELLHFLQQNPAAAREFGNPRDQAPVPDDAPQHWRVPFLHRRPGQDLALVYDYCNWLSRQNQIPESEWCYPLWVDLEKIRSIVVQPQGLGFRLLTTAEWQSANRSAEALQSARSPDGPVMLNYAWYHDNAKFHTPAVGFLLPNANGLYDMFGNVEEVCHSTTIIDAGFYMMGRTVRAQLSGLSNQPTGVAGAPLPADHIHEFHTGFRLARMIQSARPAE